MGFDLLHQLGNDGRMVRREVERFAGIDVEIEKQRRLVRSRFGVRMVG